MEFEEQPNKQSLTIPWREWMGESRQRTWCEVHTVGARESSNRST